MTAFDRQQEGPALKKFIVIVRANVEDELDTEAASHEEAVKQFLKRPPKKVATLIPVEVESEDGEAWHVQGSCSSCKRPLMRHVKSHESNVDYGKDEGEGESPSFICSPCYGERPEAP